MRRAARIAAIVLALALAVPVVIAVASELGGEVVVLRTRDAAGEPVETRLWVVDDAGRAWLRAGAASSGWYRRLEARPDVELTRSGDTRAYRAVPVRTPDARDRIHALMRAKYGWADALIDLIRDPDGAIAVRLDARQSQSSP